MSYDLGVRGIIPPYMTEELAACYEAEATTAGGGAHGVALSPSKADILRQAIAEAAKFREVRGCAMEVHSPSHVPAAHGILPLVSTTFTPITSGRKVWDSKGHTYPPGGDVINDNFKQTAEDLLVHADPAETLAPGGRPSFESTTCFTNLRVVDDFYQKTFNRYPVNSGTRLLNAFINAHIPFDNAFWVPQTQSMYYSELMEPRLCTKPMVHFADITAHELGHAVVGCTANFTYHGQSGALNESIADVFAVMLTQQTARPQLRGGENDTCWLIAPGLIVNVPAKGTALRSMKEPGKAFLEQPYYKSRGRAGNDQQVGHFDDYIVTLSDNGGVHLNSGIPNRAFYEAAFRDGGNYSWERIGQVWNRTLDSAHKDDNFATFAARTIGTARQMYDERVEAIVAKAWHEVGVDLRTWGIAVPAGASADAAIPVSFSKNYAFVAWLIGGFITGVLVGKKMA